MKCSQIPSKIDVPISSVIFRLNILTNGKCVFKFLWHDLELDENPVILRNIYYFSPILKKKEVFVVVWSMLLQRKYWVNLLHARKKRGFHSELHISIITAPRYIYRMLWHFAQDLWYAVCTQKLPYIYIDQNVSVLFCRRRRRRVFIRLDF